MPDMSGQQMRERLHEIQPHLPVLFMSGYTDDAVVRHGVLESETNFIQKPFTYTALTAAVRKAIDERAVAPVAPSSVACGR